MFIGTKFEILGLDEFGNDIRPVEVVEVVEGEGEGEGEGEDEGEDEDNDDEYVRSEEGEDEEVVDDNSRMKSSTYVTFT